jgi:hypothetical protein
MTAFLCRYQQLSVRLKTPLIQPVQSRFQLLYYVLQEQVTAGIACYGKFGKADDLYTFAVSFDDELNYHVGIVLTVCHLDIRRSTGNFYKSILHNLPPERKRTLQKNAASLLV